MSLSLVQCGLTAAKAVVLGSDLTAVCRETVKCGWSTRTCHCAGTSRQASSSTCLHMAMYVPCVPSLLHYDAMLPRPCASSLLRSLAAFDTPCPLQQELPWCLTLHFSGVEAKGLLPYEGESSIKSHFRQALKEASSLRYGELPCQHAWQPLSSPLMQLNRTNTHAHAHTLSRNCSCGPRCVCVCVDCARLLHTSILKHSAVRAGASFGSEVRTSIKHKHQAMPRSRRLTGVAERRELQAGQQPFEGGHGAAMDGAARQPVRLLRSHQRRGAPAAEHDDSEMP